MEGFFNGTVNKITITIPTPVEVLRPLRFVSSCKYIVCMCTNQRKILLVKKLWVGVEWYSW